LGVRDEDDGVSARGDTAVWRMDLSGNGVDLILSVCPKIFPRSAGQVEERVRSLAVLRR
jgi:hypothetical protein